MVILCSQQEGDLNGEFSCIQAHSRVCDSKSSLGILVVKNSSSYCGLHRILDSLSLRLYSEMASDTVVP